MLPPEIQIEINELELKRTRLLKRFKRISITCIMLFLGALASALLRGNIVLAMAMLLIMCTCLLVIALLYLYLDGRNMKRQLKLRIQQREILSVQLSEIQGRVVEADPIEDENPQE